VISLIYSLIYVRTLLKWQNASSWQREKQWNSYEVNIARITHYSFIFWTVASSWVILIQYEICWDDSFSLSIFPCRRVLRCSACCRSSPCTFWWCWSLTVDDCGGATWRVCGTVWTWRSSFWRGCLSSCLLLWCCMMPTFSRCCSTTRCRPPLRLSGAASTHCCCCCCLSWHVTSCIVNILRIVWPYLASA